MKIFRSLLPTLVLSALAMPASAAVRPCDPPIMVTPNALTTATTGIAYSQTMTASGGTAYTFSITQGVLPPGFALTNPTSTAVDITGTPTTAGTFAFTLTARNTPNGCSGGRTFALPVNDRTVVTTTAGTTAFVENGSPVVVDPGVTVTDSDNPNLASATITITNPQDGAAEVLAATACAGLTVTPGLNSLSITGAQPPATYQTCLRSVTYHDSSRNPGVTPRVVSFVANDGTANSAPANKTVTVAAVNDPPVANPISPPAFPEDTASTITLSYTDAEGDLATTCAVTSPTNVTVSTPCSCTAGVCSVGVTGTPANYNGAASFTYSVTANGQTSNSATASLTISAVNDAPTVTTSAGTTAFTEDGGAVVVDGGVAVADVDNANFASATVTITNPADGASEVLSATACPGLTVTPGTNNLSITGSQPLAVYQTCLRSVRYDNTSQNPGTTARIVAFVVNDGALASAAANKSVSVAAANDPPVVTRTAGTTVFVVGGGPVVVDSGLTVTDPDDTNLASATVNITNPVNGASEVLAATACAGLTVTPGVNSLSISGNQPLATYQSCLRSVSYNNTAASPGTAARTIRFVANDGDVNSANADKLLDAAPRVTGTTPANGAINVGAGSNVVVSFSEPVNVTATSFTIECPVGTLRPFGFVGGTTNVSSVTLDPTANLPNGQVCTVTVVGAQVSDSDPADPPDTAGANVVFSFGVPPDAVNDLYPDTIVGNVRVSSGARTPPYTTAANDVSALAFTITAFDAVTAQGGQVMMTTSGAALGQLVYNPPAGFEGSDTFTYTIANAGGSDIATVTVPVGGMIWFVQNGAPNCTTRVNGCGRLTNPYSSLPSFQAENNGTNPTLNPANGDRVFVYENATSYAGPVTLLADQRFIGQDATSSLAVLAALTPPSGSDALPPMNSGNGTFTTITNGAGNGVNVGSNGNQVHGLTISGTTGRALGNTSNVGTFTMSDVGVNTSATTGPGIAFTGGGAVTATGTNTISSGTGTALNVASTTIGAGGLTFRSITSNGSTNGIVLNNTGAGALTVTGNSSGLCGGQVTGGGATVTAPNAADCTGGVIQSTSGPGVLLTSAGPVSLTRMRVASVGDDGIRGVSVNGFTLTASLIENNGNAVGERGIEMTNLSGTGGITQSTVRGSSEHNVLINNTSATLSSFPVTSSQFSTPSFVTGDDGIQLLIDGTGTMTASVTQSAFTDNKGDHFQAASTASSTGSITIDFSSNTLITTPANDPNVIGGGITINPGNAADITFTIANNNIQQSFDDAININHDPSSTVAGVLRGTISGNTIGTPADPGSGSESSNTITIAAKGAGATIVAVTNNTVRQWVNAFGIFLGATEGSGNLDATVTGNTLSNPDPALALNGIHVAAGATASDNATLCASVTGNNVTGAGTNGLGNTDIRLRQRFLTTIRLPGYAGSNSDTAAVNAFVAANNDPPGPVLAPTVSSIQNVGGGGGGFVGGGSCVLP